MTTLEAGDTAPDFTTTLQDGSTVSLSDYRGKYLVLYFYPKDDTPGCTKEACAFRDMKAEFDKRNVAVLGVSKDTEAKHQKFIDKYELNFPLAADTDGTLMELYGAWGEKNMYGKTFMGVKRMTFVIDPDGKIKKMWKAVKVAGHDEKVLEAIDA